MRKKRITKQGARYHVTGRANRRELILEDPAVKELFLSVLKRAKTRYRFSIDHFCIMNNHYHMIIQPARGESLSKIMQWIMSVFAINYNKKNGLTGHVWGERFFSKIIESIDSLKKIISYIDHNPVKANLVDTPEKWKYGGLYHFIDRSSCILSISGIFFRHFLLSG